ncbi:hypothetical protein TVAG_340660 [Trichomonas vaginalis G3]|uniref:Uncharacterized protein n=1 Tax=Trichomonas vaginalis (strain ATCC PRA-98 / G3) TaxID=412133 RepID=A2DTM5_TRIV3|nr:armadillo (ARM) repeat-containing protein family [Trichomonas vaginalis G3]EAY16172.1 hypothetical protein TVAG_340660 [Trichomonas vaginalis G3]KAI5493337.1 armadillo (ARM) repeat-containing protein family [Trichomonas vaginalis G3]|eukprot:XP_001328395.1 hypothetical protein [Trichomonas vaginalis G3]
MDEFDEDEELEETKQKNRSKITKIDGKIEELRKEFKNLIKEVLRLDKDQSQEELFNTIEYLGQFVERNRIFIINFYITNNIHPIFMKIITQDPPDSVLSGIIKIMIPLFQELRENQLDDFLSEENLIIFLRFLDSEDPFSVKRILNFLSVLVRLDQNLRDFIYQYASIQKVNTLCHSIEEKIVEIFCFKYLASVVFLPNFENYLELIGFCFEAYGDLTLESKIFVFELLYNIQSSHKEVLDQIQQIGTEFNPILSTIPENEYSRTYCPYVLFLLIEFIRHFKTNEFLDQTHLIELTRLLDFDNDVRIIELILKVFIEICDDCQNPFTNDQISDLLSLCVDSIRDSTTNVKISASILIGKLFSYASFHHLNFLALSGVANYIAQVLSAANASELVQILKWVHQLLSSKNDPKITQFFAEMLLDDNLLDVLEELEEGDNEEIAKIANLISVEINFPDSNDQEAE